MSLLLLVAVSKLVLFSPVSYAESSNTETKKVAAPYYCNGLKLKRANRSPENQMRAYEFSGICSYRDLASDDPSYKRVWMEIRGRWDEKTNQAIEYAEITAGGVGKLRMTLKCVDDPWITNAKCVVEKFENQTKIDNFEALFRVRKRTSDGSIVASYPPLARATMTPTQIKQFVGIHKSIAMDSKIKVHKSNKEHKSYGEQPKTKSRLIIAPIAAKPVKQPENKNSKVYTEPKYNGHRIAWCYHWGSDCGKTAADAWCRFNKFDSAQEYKIDYNLGKTLVIGDNRMCNHRSCAGFKSIVCQKKTKEFAKR